MCAASSSIAGRRILVTGASGFIGINLVRALADEGADITALVHRRSGHARELGANATVIAADLADAATLRRSVARSRPDGIVHLAWHGLRHPAHRREQLAVNVAAVASLVQAGAAAGCAAFVGIGSQEEYAPSATALREDAATIPRTQYGLAKLVAGSMAAALCRTRGLRCVWPRLFLAYGPDDRPPRLVPYIIEKLIHGRAVALTTGRQTRDLLYVEDAVGALVLLLRVRQAGTFNVGSGRAVRVALVARRIRDLIDRSATLRLGGRAEDEGSGMDWHADIGKLQQLGWRPLVALDDGLRRTIDWHRAYCQTTRGSIVGRRRIASSTSRDR